MVVDGKNVVPDVHAVLDKIEDFSIRLRTGAFTGCTGKPIRNIVSIGIGEHGSISLPCIGFIWLLPDWSEFPPLFSVRAWGPFSPHLL